MFYDQLATAIENAARCQLDDYSRQVWRPMVPGIVADDQAQQLAELIQRRRGPVDRGSARDPMSQRRATSSSDPRSSDRRTGGLRFCGGASTAATGPLPPHLAAGFTTGELAVLKVISDEWLAHGACDRSLNELAARAGVCQSLAKRAVRLAELDGLFTVQRRPRSGRKHLTNVIRIIRAEWLDWLRKGRRKTYATNACNRAKPIFAEVRGVQNNPPRSQHSRNSDSGSVDNIVKKEKSDRRWSRRALF